MYQIRTEKQNASARRLLPATLLFLSFFLGFRRPNLITGLSGWRTPDLAT